MNAPDEHSRAPKYALCPVDQIQICGVTTSLERPRPRRWPPAGCVGLQERWHDHWSPAWAHSVFGVTLRSSRPDRWRDPSPSVFATGGAVLPRRSDGVALLYPSPWPSDGRPAFFPLNPAFINANHL